MDLNTFTSAFPPDEPPAKVVRGKVVKQDAHQPRYVDGMYTLVDFTQPRAKCLLYSLESASLVNCHEPMDLICSKTYHSMNYGGFQYGQWGDQLGDGRVIHHGDIRNKDGMIWDISLKGIGRTPFSRYGDGFLTLQSAVKEYIGLEYLNAIGIPTTRALALYGTGFINREIGDVQNGGMN
jgi:hypothetical protein